MLAELAQSFELNGPLLLTKAPKTVWPRIECSRSSVLRALEQDWGIGLLSWLLELAHTQRTALHIGCDGSCRVWVLTVQLQGRGGALAD